VGRRSFYTVNESASVSHPALESILLRDVLGLLTSPTAQS
jgi:hypothetical protein